MEPDHALDFVSAPILGQDKLTLSRLSLKAERDSRRDGTLSCTVPRYLYFGMTIKIKAYGRGIAGICGLGFKEGKSTLEFLWLGA
jgi:hypothetical protein